MPVPTVTISESARQAIREALADAEYQQLRITISPAFRYELEVGPSAADDVLVAAEGFTILFDPASAERAEGLLIDFVDDGERTGFTMHNPGEPPKVRQVSAPELKTMIDSGLPLRLVDVRTREERAMASIEGSHFLDYDERMRLSTLDRETPLVFQCHHGMRSQSAAEHYLRDGFRNVYNLSGGIDAWSRLVDPAVPRY